MKRTHINESTLRNIIEGVVRQSLMEEEENTADSIHEVIDMLERADEMLVDASNSFGAGENIQEIESRLSEIIDDLRSSVEEGPSDEVAGIDNEI